MSSCDNLVSTIKHVHLLIRHAYDQAFAAHGVTGPQVNVMRHIWTESGIEQRTLQERLRVTSATLTGIIDGLVERELVERRLSPDDARVKQLFLTEGGQQMGNELAQVFPQLEQRLLEGFSPSEQALLHDWLQRMANNLQPNATRECN